MLPSKKITKRDILLIFFVIILGALLLLPKSFAGKAGERVIVSCDGTVMSYSLKNDSEYSIVSGEYHYVLRVVNGEAAVTYSDCPDKVCVRSGRISHYGESIVCIPGHLVVTVSGTDESSDGTVG